MLNFCTLFNSTYLSRGLAMYNSLKQHCEDFHLFVVAFDSQCFDILSHMALKHVTVISMADFENARLLAVKGDRTDGEYCWTCASSSIKYCIETFALDSCTYIDADLLFFSNPKALIDEMAEKSVLITEHRYTEAYDQTATSGIYCVQFMTFKNTDQGMEVLNWWVDSCITWCFNRQEDNKFGDQKYLDDWMERYDCVHSLKHLGGGVAPWNVQQYEFSSKNGQLKGLETATGRSFDVVFYHYHNFQYIQQSTYCLSGTNYLLNRQAIKYIYRPYTHALTLAENEIHGLNIVEISHEEPGDIAWVKKKIGRSILFFIRGYYKNFYSKRSMQYSFPL